MPDKSPWLPFDRAPGGIRLYCLPHAGASASVYRSWSGALAGVSVRPVQLPGRETRLRDPLILAMGPLVEALADAVLAEGPGPYAVYGHSLGGLIGFELIREIRRRGGDNPAHLFVSGCPSPDQCPEPSVPKVTGLDDEQVVSLLSVLGGTPAWMLADQSVRQMILPPFRADFSVKETYRYLAGPPLPSPVTVLAATGDAWTPAATMGGWRDHTTGRFDARTLDGGHFAVLEQAPLTHAVIAEALRPWTGTGPAQLCLSAASPAGGAR